MPKIAKIGSQLGPQHGGNELTFSPLKPSWLHLGAILPPKWFQDPPRSHLGAILGPFWGHFGIENVASWPSNCPINQLDITLKNFVKKNKLNNSLYKDLSTIKNLSKINSKAIFSTNFGRDIEYYTGIVFEIYNSSKKEIARGGRYDGLLKSLGSKKNISAVGEAINLNNL